MMGLWEDIQGLLTPCYVRTFFRSVSIIIIPGGPSSALLYHNCYAMYNTKVSFVSRVDIIVVRLRYNGPYGHLGLIGYLGVDTQ
jgi:hypothetical protein